MRLRNVEVLCADSLLMMCTSCFILRPIGAVNVTDRGVIVHLVAFGGERLLGPHDYLVEFLKEASHSRRRGVAQRVGAKRQPVELALHPGVDCS